jgi:hypothetical protein
MASQSYIGSHNCPSLWTWSRLQSMQNQSRAAVLQHLSPYGVSPCRKWSSRGRSSISVLLLPEFSTHPKRGLNRRSQPTYSSSLGDPGPQSCEAIHRFQVTFRPRRHDFSHRVPTIPLLSSYVRMNMTAPQATQWLYFFAQL